MEAFDELKKKISDDILRATDRLEWLQEQVSKKDDLKKIIDMADKGDDLYLKQVEGVQNIFPDLAIYFTILGRASYILENIKNNNYQNILNADYERILLDGDYSPKDVDKIKYDINVCNSLLKYQKNDPFIKEMVTNSSKSLFNTFDELFQKVFTELVNVIRERYGVSFRSNDSYSKEINALKKYLKELKEIDALFDKNGVVKKIKNVEQLKLFYNWLDTHVDASYHQAIIRNILSFYYKSDKAANVTFDSIDLSLYTDEEKEIIRRMKSIYEKQKMKIKDRVDFSNEDLHQNRKDNYIFHNKVEWELILSDIENNLLPRILSNSESVLEIFRFIINLYDEETLSKTLYNDDLSKIDGYIDKLEKIGKFVKNYNKGYDFYVENKEFFDRIKETVTWEYASLCYDITHLVDVDEEINKLKKLKLLISDNIENNIIRSDESKLDVDRLDQIIDVCNARINEYLQTAEEKLKVDSYTNAQAKNLIFCINNIDFTDEHSRFDENKLKEFTSSIKMMSHSRFSEANFNIVTENNGTKRQDNTEIEGKYFRAFRSRHSDDYRTGFIHFTSVDPSIKKQLQERYNLDSDCAFLVAFDVIKVSANHNEYALLSDYISENRKYLEYIGSLFADPNTNIDELFKIINEGIVLRDNLINQKEM